MRAYEFITEQAWAKQVRDQLITYLITMHAMGIQQVNIDQLITSMQQDKYTVDYPYVIAIAKQMQIVDQQASDNDTIVFTDPSGKPQDLGSSRPDQTNQPPNNQTVVDKMAKSAIDKRIP